MRLKHLLGVLLIAALPAAAVAATADAAPRVAIETADGTIVIELDRERAPVTVANFLEYVDAGFYDGLIFHRVVPNFVIQGGGFDADMQRREPGEPIVNESDNGLDNERGTVAMARLSAPDTASSQFYINLRDNENLNAAPGQPGYTVFGRVISGMEIVDEIARIETVNRAGMASVPETPVVMESVHRLP